MIERKKEKKFLQFILLLSIVILFFALKTSPIDAACSTHWCCGSVGFGGCRTWDPKNPCTSGEASCNCSGTTMCCDKGDCQTCTAPSCPTHYTSGSNLGCGTTTTSCTRYYCIGGSCGTTSRTCYAVKYTVTYDGNSGTCTPSSREVCYNTTSAAPSCSRTGYTLTGFTRTSGSGGTLNTSTGAVSNVSGNQTIRANWSIDQFTVTYDGNGGTCTPSPQTVDYNTNSTQPSCTRTGYTVTSFTRISGSGGTLNTSTGVVSNVTGTQTIRVNWSIANNSPTAPTSLLTLGETNPTGVTDITPTFSAIFNDPDSGDTSGHYQIQVNTASNFSGTSLWDSGKSSMTSTNEGSRSPDITYDGTTLTYNGQTYYWRIKFWDNNDAEGTWSSAAQFTMAVPTATYYEIEVNTTSDFTGTIMWNSGKTAMTATTAGQRSPSFTYDGVGLSGGITYYWRIRFWDMVDNLSPWSDTATFQINRNPTAPTDLETAGQTSPIKVSSSTPGFTAIYNDPDTGDSAGHYQIQVNTASDFTGTSMWDSTKTSMTSTSQGSRTPSLTYAGDTLSAGETYYWRIKLWDSNDNESPWSSTATFTMSGPPIATSLETDGRTNPTTIQSNTPSFSAIYTDPNNDNAAHYQIEVNTASNFTGTLMWDSTKTAATIPSGSRSPTYTYDGITLTHDQTIYYVRMRFWDTDDNISDWVSGQFTDEIARLLLDGLRMDGIKLD